MKKNERLFSKVYSLFTEEEEKDDVYTIYLNNEEYKGKYKIKILAIYQAITLFIDIDEKRKEYKIYTLFGQDAMDEKYERQEYSIEMLKENYTYLDEFVNSFIKEMEYLNEQ